MYLDEVVMEKEADKPGLFTGGGFLHGLLHDLLRPRALVLLVVVDDLEPIGRA
jgi:hypothetical protein